MGFLQGFFPPSFLDLFILVHLRVYGMFSPSFPVPAKAKSFNSVWVAISCSEFLGQLPRPRAAPALYLLSVMKPHCSMQNFHHSKVSSVVQGNINTWIRSRDVNGMEKIHGLPRQSLLPRKMDERSLLHLSAGHFLMEDQSRIPLHGRGFPWDCSSPWNRTHPSVSR